MTTTINAVASTGLVQTSDGSGILNVQSNGVNTNAQAWLSFNGVTTATIRASYNVSSVTRTNTGTYTISFTNALQDGNYSIVTGGSGDANGNPRQGPANGTSPSTTSFVLYTAADNTVLADWVQISVAIFR